MSPDRIPDIDKLKEKRKVKNLIKALTFQDDNWVRINAARALGEIGDSRAVIPLIAALDDETLVRDAAAKALYEIAGSSAVEPLLEALKDNRESKSKKVIWILGKIGDPRTVEPIIAALDRQYVDIYMYYTIIGALEELGDLRAIEPLIVKLGRSGWKIRCRAADGLDKLGWKPGQDENGAAYWIVRGEWDQCVRIGQQAVEPLLSAVQPADKTMRRAIYETLGKMGASAVEALLAALYEDVPNKSRAAIIALGNIGDRRATEPLLDVLNGNNEDLRELAVVALGKIGDPKAVEALLGLFRGVSESYRISAIKALGEIGDARAVVPLIQLFQKGAPIETLQAAARALKKISQSGQLDENNKRFILENQGRMNSTHSDQQVHTDTGAGCIHDDYDSHSDKGINVDFPL